MYQLNIAIMKDDFDDIFIGEFKTEEEANRIGSEILQSGKYKHLNAWAYTIDEMPKK